MFFMFIFFPIINLGFIPMRYGLASATVTEVVRRLSKAEKMSEAQTMLHSDKWWTKLLSDFGITVTQSNLSLIAYSVANHSQTAVTTVGSLPSQWLPNGANAPCIYTLELNTEIQVPPLWKAHVPGIDVPGMTQPIAFKFHTRSNWENFGKDPETQVYYVNE